MNNQVQTNTLSRELLTMPEKKYKIEVLNDAFKTITQRLGIRNALTMSQADLHVAISSIDPYVAELYQEYTDVFIDYASSPDQEKRARKDTIGSKIVERLEARQ
ncbi:MAG: hypothetical protein JST32_09110 [Bacteroidetes bacterium]|nr:hypothetical protein [Bacteroidota bacterium]